MGELLRVIINLPPRHGKSDFISMYTPAWFLGMNPDKRVILTSYEADFAAQWGRKARSLIEDFGQFFPEPIRVNPDSSAANRWDILGHTGGMQTAGIGGPLTGKGAHLAIIDDPIKNAEEAMSSTIREKHWDWYKSTLYSRLEPGGSILIPMTRWNEDDLAGRLIAEMQQEGGEQWTVISLPAVAEDDDLLGRQVGQALWPERYDEVALARIKGTTQAYWFASLYQQRPAPLEGGMFKKKWFEIVKSCPTDCYCLRYWDLAATEDGGDWTVGLKIGVRAGVFYIIDVQRDRLSSKDSEALVKQTAQIDGGEVPIEMEQEPGSSGKRVIDHFARIVLPGYAFEGVPSTGDKTVRAMAVMAAAERGDVKIVRGGWNSAFLDELAMFPNGKHDDQVDALSGAYNGINLGAFRARSEDDPRIKDALGDQMSTSGWSGDIPTL
jgi:predicted phage terminase large subunit-like protein